VNLLSGSDGKGLDSVIRFRIISEMPNAFKILPKGMIESVGTTAVQRVLTGMHERLIRDIGKDYELWATNPDFRVRREELLDGLQAQFRSETTNGTGGNQALKPVENVGTAG